MGLAVGRCVLQFFVDRVLMVGRAAIHVVLHSLEILTADAASLSKALRQREHVDRRRLAMMLRMHVFAFHGSVLGFTRFMTRI